MGLYSVSWPDHLTPDIDTSEMNHIETLTLPYLFTVLSGFILVNFLISICLYSYSKIKNVKKLSWYWGVLLLTYAFQGFFQEDQLGIILSYSLNVIPVTIMSVILFDIISRKAPIKFYLTLWLIALVITPIIHFANLGFTAASLPLSIAMGAIPLITAYELILRERRPTNLQKLMGALLFLSFFHFINFSVFRMGPGNQIWGWVMAFALYQVFSVLLFALVLEDYSRREKQRLQLLVTARTEELSKALQLKEKLFRIVLHDIATPLQGQLWIVDMLNTKQHLTSSLLPKLTKLTYMLKRIIEQVRSIEAVNSGKMDIEISPVNLDQCLQEIQTIFEGQLQSKNIQLKVINNIPSKTVIHADQTIFTTSILGNLISNAIKFSPRNSVLLLKIEERDNQVVIEIIDKGIGMPQELAFNIFDPSAKNSRPGTLGEVGTGFGMAQVKSYVDYFGGKIDIESRPQDRFPMDHGTKITLTMSKTSTSFQNAPL